MGVLRERVEMGKVLGRGNKTPLRKKKKTTKTTDSICKVLSRLPNIERDSISKSYQGCCYFRGLGGNEFHPADSFLQPVGPRRAHQLALLARGVK